MSDKPNAELAYKVLDHIDAHPETWDQGMWWCGTSGCFAGWACALAGTDPDALSKDAHSDTYLPDVAATLLGFPIREDMDAITDGAGEDAWLFCSDNTREDLGRMVEQIFGPRPDGTR